jgi:hypothetical protein
MMEGMLVRVSKAVENLEKAVKEKNEVLIKEQQQVSFTFQIFETDK